MSWFLSHTSLLVSVGPFLCPAGDLANINLMKRVALDFRLSLCTLGLPGLSGVLFEGAEGKALSSSSSTERWARGLVAVLGAGTAVSPQGRQLWDEWTSLSPHPTSKPFLGGCQRIYCSALCVVQLHNNTWREQRFHFPAIADDSALSSEISPWV